MTHRTRKALAPAGPRPELLISPICLTAVYRSSSERPALRGSAAGKADAGGHMIRSKMEIPLGWPELGSLIGMDVRGHWLARCWRRD